MAITDDHLRTSFTEYGSVGYTSVIISKAAIATVNASSLYRSPARTLVCGKQQINVIVEGTTRHLSKACSERNPVPQTKLAPPKEAVGLDKFPGKVRDKR